MPPLATPVLSDSDLPRPAMMVTCRLMVLVVSMVLRVRWCCWQEQRRARRKGRGEMWEAVACYVRGRSGCLLREEKEVAARQWKARLMEVEVQEGQEASTRRQNSAVAALGRELDNRGGRGGTTEPHLNTTAATIAKRRLNTHYTKYTIALTEIHT
jgi:hypothetical protein